MSEEQIVQFSDFVIKQSETSISDVYYKNDINESMIAH